MKLERRNCCNRKKKYRNIGEEDGLRERKMFYFILKK